MIEIKEIVRQFRSNADVMRALVDSITEEQAQWKPTQETWCLKEVMEHVYNEERFDFRIHLLEILNDPPQAWGTRQLEYISVKTCDQALDGFLIERQASIGWLTGLKSTNWNVTTTASFGPSGDVLVLKAGDVLVSWVAHDFLHIRQLNELHFSWNEKQAKPYSVQYAGGW
jgi:hypothetical protein